MSPDRLPSAPPIIEEYVSVDIFPQDVVFDSIEKKNRQKFSSPFKHRALVRFKDNDLEEDRVAVISARSSHLLGELKMLARRFSESSVVTGETFSEVLTRFTESYYNLNRRPQASIVYKDNRSTIECLEPSCRFHNNGECTNDGAMVYDDCSDNQWCMTFIPLEGIQNG